MRSSVPSLVVAAVVAAALSQSGAAAADAPAWRGADPAHAWSFPRDHWSHPGYRNEWWYFTGHLEAAGAHGRRFGYQLTFFRVGLLPERPRLDSAWAAANVVMGHAAITDLTSGKHVFSEVLYREVPFLGGFGAFPDPTIAWSRAPAGTDARWTLVRTRDGFELSMQDRARGMALRFRTRPVKPLVLEGPNGYSRKSEREGFASLYASYTRLATAGTLTAGGRTWTVAGESWMDHEMGSTELAPQQVGWDWFGLQLADGRDLMLYVLRRADGSPDFRAATLVDKGGRARYLAPSQWAVRARGRWRSPETGTQYPAGWTIEIPQERLRLRVDPEAVSQENRAAGGLFYWEGAVRATDDGGRPAGVGYVELTGYGQGTRPRI